MESNGMSEWELLEKFFAYSTCDYVNNIDEERERASSASNLEVSHDNDNNIRIAPIKH